MLGVLWPLRDWSLLLLAPLGAAIYLGVLLAIRGFDNDDRALLVSILGRTKTVSQT
jgi:hypothetical protein